MQLNEPPFVRGTFSDHFLGMDLDENELNPFDNVGPFNKTIARFIFQFKTTI
jgi:hypothetical protein